MQHLLTHVDPVYPPIAKAAHVQGDVLLHVTVDERGLVTHIDVLNGPAMLKAAALDAVKHWTYTPFQTDGRPAVAQVVVSVPFTLGIPVATEKTDQAIGQAFFPKDTECRTANSSHHWEEAVGICKDLVAIGDRFPVQSQRANELRGAHEQYGQALAYSGHVAEALPEFRKAVDIARASLTPTDAEFGGAYYWLAYGEHASHLLNEAERDYGTAENSFRKASVNLPEMKREYDRELAHTLAFHSLLARQMGAGEAADKMQAEALQLDPHSLDGMGVQKQ